MAYGPGFVFAQLYPGLRGKTGQETAVWIHDKKVSEVLDAGIQASGDISAGVQFNSFVCPRPFFPLQSHSRGLGFP